MGERSNGVVFELPLVVVDHLKVAKVRREIEGKCRSGVSSEFN